RHAPATVGTINGWVNSKTNGKIPTILKAIDPAQVMLLIDAIYFKGHWRNGFDPSKTQAGEFHPASGSVQDVPMMSLHGKLSFAFTTDAQVAELPYGNGAFAMTIAIPASGHTINQLMAGLDAAHYAGWVAQLRDDDLDLSVPKFTFDYSRQLNDDLSALGMRIAFDTLADFSRIATLSRGEHLFISNVTQKTFVDVNEDGTEAAAVTSVGISRSASKTPVIEINQPFLFVLRERLSGTIFFVGQVNRIP
ncbi:MAG: serpin family protein, partial [Gemmatimonadota bacterium]